MPGREGEGGGEGRGDGPDRREPPESPDHRGESFRILFVCSGNTCRSPLAEVITRELLRERGWAHVRVRSAGAYAAPGTPASEGSLRAAERHGLDLSDHVSTPLRPEAVRESDLILVMSPHHLLAVVEMGGGGRASLLTAFAEGHERQGEPGEGVPDPVGGDEAEYEETYRTLRRLIEGALERLEPVLAP